MTREQYKQQQRQQRIEANKGAGVHVGQFMTSGMNSNFDNNAAWSLRDAIAKEILPEIRRRQRAWACCMPD